MILNTKSCKIFFIFKDIHIGVLVELGYMACLPLLEMGFDEKLEE